MDAFKKAAADCLHPRILTLSLLPVLLTLGISVGLGYLWGDDALQMLRQQAQSYPPIQFLMQWLDTMGLTALRQALLPMLLLLIVVPLVLVLVLLLVALFITPVMVNWVADQRFKHLERKKGASFLSSLAWSLGSGILAGLALLLSIPLWVIPPLILVLPPLIAGWLTYRVMSFDALAEHASRQERLLLLRENRGALFLIGLVSAYLGAAPSLVWAWGSVFVLLAPLTVPLALWLYTWLLAFSSLWFAHYLLAALTQLRARDSSATTLAPHPTPFPFV